EQLTRALMQATGLTDAERQVQGAKADEAALHARLAGNYAPFVAAFAGAPGQPEGQGFEATLAQALFLRNGALVRSWLAPRPGNLTDRLGKLPAAAVADELYLSVLTRPPGDEERREVADYLNVPPSERPAALEGLAWALLTSAEFRFNH